ARTTLSAVTGIGTAGAIDTQVANLVATNSGTAGNIQINETDALVIRTVTTTGAGNIKIQNLSDGTLSTTGVVSSDSTGNIDLLSFGALSLGANVTSAGGNITLAADTDSSDGTGAQKFEQTAGAIGSGGGTVGITVAMAAGTGTGGAELRAINSGVGTLTVTSHRGSIIEDASGSSLLTASGNITLKAGETTKGTTGVGTLADAINTQSSSGTINATAGSGGIFIDEADAAVIGTVTTTGAGNIKLVAGGALTLGAITTTGAGYLDVTAGGDITQNGILTIGGSLWAMSSGNIFLKSLNALSGNVSLLAGTGKEAWLNATRIEVGKVRPSDSTTTNVGITAANVTLEAPSGGAFITANGTAGGLVTATAHLSSTAALTIRTLPGNGVIGNVSFPVTQGLYVNTDGLVQVFGDAISAGTIHLVGDDSVQPKYEFSGNPLYRSVKYNGVEATNAQLTGALDAAYLDIRNQTTEIRESGFAKENANKVLRRGVVTSAGPGQPAIDDSTGLASAELCDGNFKGGQLACQ
ncbi:MAG: hypothetical protein K9J74_04285, partial [Sulfuritalea sp.]|nr:hypothetical protein [Sulfuritalea sp.]